MRNETEKQWDKLNKFQKKEIIRDCWDNKLICETCSYKKYCWIDKLKKGLHR